MQNVIRIDQIRAGSAALAALMLAGCAATHTGARPEPGSGNTPLSQKKAIPHTSTTNISGTGVTSDVAAKTAPAPAAAPASPVKAGEAAPEGDKAASAKTQLFPGTGVFVKPPAQPETAAKPPTGDEVMLNFDGADLREVVKAIIVDFLHETYIMDSKVQGVVSLHTTSPIPRTALLPTLETLLRMNGAAVVKEEGIFKVVPAAAAVRGSVTPQLGGGKRPFQSGFTVQIVPLKFISAKEMAKIMEPYATEAAAVRFDEPRNLMVLGGTEAELRHLIDTVEMFDVDWLAGMSIGMFTLQSVDVKTAVADLDKVFGGQNSPLAGVLRFVPIERLNAILVVTPQPKYLEQAKTWIERMDRAGGAGGGTRLFVYAVQNGQAEKLSGLINDLFSKSGKAAQKTTPAATVAPGLTPSVVNTTPPVTAVPTPAAPGQPPGAANQPQANQLQAAPGSGDNLSISGDVRVIADKDNNALLVLASPSDYEKIEAAIRKLDVVPRQVFVDVTVAELSLEGDLQFGLAWYFAKSKDLVTGNPFGNGNRGTLDGTNGAQYIWSNARVGAIMNLLQTDHRTKVISSPHLMVTENQVAKINVGSSISVTTQQQSVVGTTTGILTGTQYVATGIILSVTPHIHAGGMVTLEIDQQVTIPSNTSSAGGNPNIDTRAIQSTVAIKSGETMVLGGLIQERSELGMNGLPFLSQIPVLGGLFGSQDRKTNRVELVMLITPRVVENNNQAREVATEFRKKLSGLADYFEKSQKAEEKPGKEKQESVSPISK